LVRYQSFVLSYFWWIWKFEFFICWIFLKYFLIVDTKNWISFISKFIQNLNFTFLRDAWTKIESKIEVEWWRKLNIQYLHVKKLASNSVDMQKIKKWERNQGEHAEKDTRGPKRWLSTLTKKLMWRRQTKNNQVYLVYGVCNQSNGFERFPTVRDLSRSPTLEGALTTYLN
jgi:hypothetical protein